MNVKAGINITPARREYVTTIPCPEVVNNALKFITARVNQDDADAHTNIRIEYPLEYTCPGSVAIAVIDTLLEQRGINWRIHSAHVLTDREVCRLIIRKVSLLDFTAQEAGVTSPADVESVRVVDIYSKQYKQDYIVGPSNISVFSLPVGGFYFVYTRVFDMWEYSDDFPEVGWKEIP